MQDQLESEAIESGQADMSESVDDAGQADVVEPGQGNDAFDPNSLPDEIRPHYERMLSEVEAQRKSQQADYTRKTQQIAEQRRKIEAYDAFQANPLAGIQQIAKQYGLSVSQAAQVQQQAQDDTFEPQTWADVASYSKRQAEAAKQAAIEEVRQMFRPIQQWATEAKRSSLEKQFDEALPEWRQYEPAMVDVISRHPSLVNDPKALLRAAVGDDVWESRAMKKAITKLNAQRQNSQISSGSTVAKQETKLPDKPSFEQAVAAAKRIIAQKGSGRR